MLDGYGWRGIFWAGAALSAVLFPIALAWLPESLDFLLTRQPTGALNATNRVLARMDVPPIDCLPARPDDSAEGSTPLWEFRQPVHLRELAGKLFIAHALNLFAWYFIINWGPPLVAEAGAATLGPVEGDALGARYSAWVSYGGIVGGLTAGWLCGTVGVRRMMWVSMIALAVLVGLFGLFVDQPSVLVVLAPPDRRCAVRLGGGQLADHRLRVPPTFAGHRPGLCHHSGPGGLDLQADGGRIAADRGAGSASGVLGDGGARAALGARFLACAAAGARPLGAAPSIPGRRSVARLPQANAFRSAHAVCAPSTL